MREMATAMVYSRCSCNSLHTNMNANTENMVALVFVGEQVWVWTKKTVIASESKGEVDEVTATTTALSIHIHHHHCHCVPVWREERCG
jgi:hypothetical protein